ncbi:DNA replication ATP-dependent helicase/nuclease DNA2-like [Tubulanus polymorphus]|uniref:DNA replication ATP-dependent helicase/nuclease DNA2-like n=1 Tax=Tubulanus polymorphus TaxID=672921 RepID=UPI003DA33421
MKKMGKLSLSRKKPNESTPSSEKQTRISKFFQQQPENTPAKSSLFTVVGRDSVGKSLSVEKTAIAIDDTQESVVPKCFDGSIASPVVFDRSTTPSDITRTSRADSSVRRSSTESDSSVILATPEEKLAKRFPKGRSFLAGLGQYTTIGSNATFAAGKNANGTTKKKAKPPKVAATPYDGVNYRIDDYGDNFEVDPVRTAALLGTVMPVTPIETDLSLEQLFPGGKLIFDPSPSPSILSKRKVQMKRSAAKGLSPNPKRALPTFSPSDDDKVKRHLDVDFRDDADIVMSTPVTPVTSSNAKKSGFRLKNSSIYRMSKTNNRCRAKNDDELSVTTDGDDILDSLLTEIKVKKSSPKLLTAKKNDHPSRAIKTTTEKPRVESAAVRDKNETEVLADIINEIRGCTQAPKQHGYDKSLQSYQSRLSCKENRIRQCSGENTKAKKARDPDKLSPSYDTKFSSPMILNEGPIERMAVSSTPAGVDAKSATLEGAEDSSQDELEVSNERSFQKLASSTEATAANLWGGNSNAFSDSGGFMPFSNDDSWMEHIDLDNPEDGLTKKLSQLSPFKQSAPCVENYDPQSIHAPAAGYGRHVVINVHMSNSSLTLDIQADDSGPVKKCILTGFWMDTIIKCGDVVHILADFDGNDTAYVSDEHGLLVVNPDFLISGTTVVSTVYCMRKSVLNNKFKGSEGTSIHMLKGSMIHSLFQEVLERKTFTLKGITETARKILQQKPFLHDMYTLGLKEQNLMEEIEKFIPQIKLWMEKYTTVNKQHIFGERAVQRSAADVEVLDVKDIEENVWSPRFGIKGKVDVTVEVRIQAPSGRERKVVPLELKTGKPSFSVEHKGQVTLYSMMMSDRRIDPESGLLLYLLDGSMKVIPAHQPNKRGLIQLRNELAQYLSNSLTKTEDGWRLADLPQPINNSRGCSKCSQLLNCTAYQKCIENRQPSSGHAMENLIPSTLSHLNSTHLRYYAHWCLLFHLEANVDKKKMQNIWCMTALKRESHGECLHGMILNDSAKQLENGRFVQTFRKHPKYAMKLANSVLSASDSIVVSCENKCQISLTMGIVQSVTEDSIALVVDRDLRKYSDWKSMVFRIDKCDYYNSMGSNFNNVSKLMEDTPVSAKLRELVIDLRVPEFNHVLPKTDIAKVKHIFKLLNKPQKTAVLKVLMCRDYVLIKGYPGTGKTSTIVSLVRVLSAMGLSVLLTSYTHSAVDNILLKMTKHKLDFLRLGRLERIHRDIQQFSAEHLTKDINNVADLEMFYASKMIVATTCLGVSHAMFTQRMFDVCIIDEASQVLQPACIGPLFFAKKFALVGDPEQLPPVVQSKDAVALGMAESLFQRLDTSHATYELNVQYRMNRPIMTLSNELVYNGALKCNSVQQEQQCLQIPKLDVLLQLQESCQWLAECISGNPGREVVFVDTTLVPCPESRNAKGMMQNEKEAVLCSQIVHALLTCGIEKANVGVISPYRNQVQLLAQTVEGACGCGVEVNTVDQYQGRDKDIIIISFTRSVENLLKMAGDILEDIRRLNVAVTRARCKLILLGCKNTLRHFTPLSKLIEILASQQILPLPVGADRIYTGFKCATSDDEQIN